MRDKAGEIFVFGAQAVGDPGPHGGADEVGGSAVKEEGGGAVGDAFGVHGMNEAEIVNVLVDFRKEGGGPAATLAVLGEVPGGFHDALG